jgi:hypothetical protein
VRGAGINKALPIPLVTDCPSMQFQRAHVRIKSSEKPAPIFQHGHFMGTMPTALWPTFANRVMNKEQRAKRDRER